MKSYLAIAALLLLANATTAWADDPDAAAQAERWHDVSSAIFGDKPIADGSDLLRLSVPVRTMDAALVPMTMELTGARHIAAISLVVDNNPSPLVGTFHLGPAFVQQGLKLRVRVNEFSLVHAVVETDDGKLYAVSQYVKAAGGCSAPSTGQSAEILALLGKMQLRRVRSQDTSKIPTQLLINHPNYNGMQRAFGSDNYTDARYLESISVSVGGVKVFDAEGGISLSEDPSISFTYTPQGNGVVDVMARDSLPTLFTQSFPAL